MANSAGGGRLLSSVPDEAGVVGGPSADVPGRPEGTWIAGGCSGCRGELAGPASVVWASLAGGVPVTVSRVDGGD